MTITATYSPDDNKIRIYASTRLDTETYARVKAAGFKWAPKQDLFVAPMWTPDRADLAIELAGDIDDEDTALIDRAEDRADRFDGYRERRTRDAEAAQSAAAAIMDGIPMGQPILVGHHSERHARRDAERIENGIRKAIRMWDTAAYWKARAAGAIRHAKYKERPDVRARRIKTIEADRRKREKDATEARQWIAAWRTLNDPRKDGTPCDDALRLKRATWIANYSHISIGPTAERPHGDSLWSALDGGRLAPRAAMLIALKVHARTIAHARRWIEHYDHRLAYERAMLAADGGLITDRTEYPIVPGGQVQIGAEWLTVIRVNRTDGRIVSVTTNARYVRVKGIESVKDYRPPTTEDAARVNAAKKLPPLVNIDSPDARRMTADEYKRMPADYRGTRTVEATTEHGAYRYRSCFKGGGTFSIVSVFLTDSKVIPLPSPDDSPNPPTLPRRPVERAHIDPTPTPPRQVEPSPVDALRATLAAGVQVVTAPQLFPTPPDVAAHMVELADIRREHRVLEPSAGTGALLAAMADLPEHPATAKYGRVHAVEINGALCPLLRETFPQIPIHHGDFLTMTADDFGGTFDRILMNPPFENAADIKHIQHARRMLAPGGRLVAVCANGPRQQEQLRPDASTWEELPAGTFAGTNVRAALLVIEAEPETQYPPQERPHADARSIGVLDFGPPDPPR